jgi:PKD repeat protein
MSAGVTITVGVPVNQSPVALAGVDPIRGTTLDEYFFWGWESYDPDGVVNSYLWTVNSTVVSTNAEFLWRFANAGNYTVTLTVTDDKGATATDGVVVEVLTPTATVGVELYDGVAGEPVNAAGTGKFRVVRVGGDVNQAVTVNLAINGTAINGVDYTLIASQVVIRARTTYTDVNVYPKVDGEIEPDEFVTLAVLAGTGYAIDPEKSAGACIVKDGTDLSTPMVSLSLLDGNATEPVSGPTTDNGKVTFKRTSRLHEVLKVNVAIGGIAFFVHRRTVHVEDITSMSG